MTQTIFITGASAGISRATARQYGERGANVGLIARGKAYACAITAAAAILGGAVAARLVRQR